MFLEVKFIQKLNVRPAVEARGQLDVLLSQTAVQTGAVRTQLVVLSFGNSTASVALAKHAATHFEGGSDEIKPYDIGAAMKNGDLEELFKSLKLISPFVSSPDFLAAMLGYGFGGYVDENGESHVWADHIHGRVSFETLEMRYRKLLVSGEDVLVSSGGVVEEVLPFGETYLSTTNGRRIITQDGRKIIVPSNGRVVFKLKGEEGIDLQQFDTDDILRYTWRDTKTGNSGASGWLRIKHNFNTFWYEAEVVSGSPEWLQKGMTLGQFGNYTKKYRQGFINISARDKHIAIWDDVDSHILAPSMLKAYLGDLRYVTDSDFPMMQGFGLYSMSCYLKGVFMLKNGKRVDDEFDRVETEFQIIDGKIASKVSNQEFTSLWQQEADAIISEVSGGGFKSYILQKADSIELSALETRIKGDLLVDGKIKASLIDVDKLVAKQLFANIPYRGEIQVGGTITTGFGTTRDVSGIAGNPRFNEGETERDELQADFFLGIQGSGGGILTISESGSFGAFIKVDRTGYYTFLSNIKRTIISTSQIRIQNKNNTAFFDATVDPDYTGSDLKLFAKKLPIKSQVSGTAGIPWGALYVNKNTGQIYSE